MIAPLLCALALPASADLRYDLTLSIDDPASETVHARARLEGLQGPLLLHLPEAYAYTRLSDPRLAEPPMATGPDGEALTLEREAPYRWRLEPGEAVAAELSWSVLLDHRRLPETEGDAFEHPYLDADHGMLVLGALVLAPGAPFEASLRFELPEGWALEAPWPEAAPGLFRPPSHLLQTDLVAVGAWDLHRTEIGGMDVTLAFAPGQRNLFELVARDLPPILEVELELFGGAVQPRYLFLFGRPDQAQGYGGSPQHSSMTLFASADLPADFVAGGLRHLIAHEFHHTWMRARCQPHDELRFLMEGFTDYYAWQVPWRLLHVDDAAYLDSLERELTRGAEALAAWGDTLLAAGGPAFFGGGPPYDACYAGGLAQALWLDLALRREGRGTLDELLRRFYEDPRWRDGTRPTLEHWLALVQETLGPDLTAAHSAALHRPGGPDLVEQFALLQIDLRRVDQGLRLPDSVPERLELPAVSR